MYLPVGVLVLQIVFVMERLQLIHERSVLRELAAAEKEVATAQCAHAQERSHFSLQSRIHQFKTVINQWGKK